LALPLDYRQRLQQILGGDADPLRDAVLGRLRTQESADPQAASSLDPNRLVQPPLNGAWVNGQWVSLTDEPEPLPSTQLDLAGLIGQAPIGQMSQTEMPTDVLDEEPMSATLTTPGRVQYPTEATTMATTPQYPSGSLINPPSQTPAPPPDTATEDMGRWLTTGPPDRLMKAWWEAGPKTAVRGAQEIAGGAYAPGFNKLMAGGAMTMAPTAPGMFAAAPVASTLGMIGGTALTLGGQQYAAALGATPEQAEAAGNIAGLADPFHVGAAAAPFVLGSVMRRLPSELEPKLVRAIIAHPELKDALKWLHPQELAEFAHMTPAAQAHAARVITELPSKEFFGAIARAGIAKKGWYQFSRTAIDHIFGNDAGLFAGILASTSPQTSVESNLTNALNIYKNWITAGRPTDRAAIVQIMGQSVQGTGTSASLLNAWVNNTVDVLQGAQSISGPKVDSFWKNLTSRPRQTPHGAMDNEDAATLDAWMGNLLSMASEQFSGSATKPQAARGAPGYSSGYLATTARMREAAPETGLTTAEMQETMWSWAMALYEQARKTGVPAVDIVKNNLLPAEAISGTPDFTTLFHAPEYQQIIQAMGPGHAARLQTLQPAQFAPLHNAPITQADHQWQLDAARRLDELLTSRKLTTEAKVGTTTPGFVNQVFAQEAMPGKGTGIMKQLFDKTQGVRDAIARRLLDAGEDLAGRSIPLKATGQPNAATTIGVGVWTPRGGKTEFNTMRAATVQAPLVITSDGAQALDPGVRALVDVAERVRAFSDAQAVAAYHGLIYDDKLPKDALHVATPKKLKDEALMGITDIFPASKYAIANTGEYINVLRTDGKTLRPRDQARLEQYVKGLPGFDPKFKWDVKEATNVGGDFHPAPKGVWTNRPDRPVTKWGTEGFEALPPDQQAAFDSDEMKAMWARKHAIMSEAKAKGYSMPPAFLNALKILSEGGVSALRKAIGDPNQLLPLLVMAGVVRAAGSPLSDQSDARTPPSR
jgi:hypothetical protein